MYIRSKKTAMQGEKYHLDTIFLFYRVRFQRKQYGYSFSPLQGFYNASRPHQGIDQRTPIPIDNTNMKGSIARREVLGGMINDYYRSAA